MPKPREYSKRILITCKNHEWTVKFLEGDEGDESDRFVSRKDLNRARRIMFTRHRLYQREKLMQKRRTKNEGILKIKPDTGVQAT